MNTDEIPAVPVEVSSVKASVSENTSGMGVASIVPEEVKGFSWGGTTIDLDMGDWKQYLDCLFKFCPNNW